MGNCKQAEKNQLDFFNSTSLSSGLGNAAQTTKLQNCQGLCFRNSSYLPVNKGKTMNSPSHKLPDQNQEAKGSFSCASTCKWVHWPNNTMVADSLAIGNVAFKVLPNEVDIAGKSLFEVVCLHSRLFVYLYAAESVCLRSFERTGGRGGRWFVCSASQQLCLTPLLRAGRKNVHFCILAIPHYGKVHQRHNASIISALVH